MQGALFTCKKNCCQVCCAVLQQKSLCQAGFRLKVLQRHSVVCFALPLSPHTQLLWKPLKFLALSINIYEILRGLVSLSHFASLVSAFEKTKPICGCCVVRDSDRFITSLLLQKCDRSTMLYVFPINLCLCKRFLPAALCCLCFDSLARNPRR